MKPTYTLLAVFLFLATAANAQYMDVNAGWAIPSGSFSNSNISKPEDGFAQSGGAVGVTLQYPVYKKLGLCVKYNFSAFNFNTNEFSEQINAQAYQGTTQTVSTNERYKSTSALAGLYLSLGKKKLTLDIHVVGGFVYLKTPSLLYTTTYTGKNYTTTMASYNDVSAAIGYGFGLKYALPKNLYATLHLDNVNANMQFPKYAYQSSSEDMTTKPYQAYSITLGLGYAIQ